MNKKVSIRLIPGAEAVSIVDPFFEKEGKHYRARDIDMFFAAFIDNQIVGACRFCIEEETPLLRSMIVHAPLRAQKIGAKILESFARYLDENKYGPTYCLPYDHLGNFYGLIGFEIIKDEEAPLFLQERVKKYRENSSDAYMVMRRKQGSLEVC